MLCPPLRSGTCRHRSSCSSMSHFQRRRSQPCTRRTCQPLSQAAQDLAGNLHTTWRLSRSGTCQQCMRCMYWSFQRAGTFRLSMVRRLLIQSTTKFLLGTSYMLLPQQLCWISFLRYMEYRRQSLELAGGSRLGTGSPGEEGSELGTIDCTFTTNR